MIHQQLGLNRKTEDLKSTHLLCPIVTWGWGKSFNPDFCNNSVSVLDKNGYKYVLGFELA